MLKFLLGITILFLYSCGEKDLRPIYSDFKPILMESDKIYTDLSLMAARPAKQIKQIRTMDQYTFALDYGLGLHIFDYSNKQNPIRIGFYQIPACVDFEIKNKKIYANNLQDLIIIDFIDMANPQIIQRKKSVFNIQIKAPDGSKVFPNMEKLPANSTIISYESL